MEGLEVKHQHEMFLNQDHQAKTLYAKGGIEMITVRKLKVRCEDTNFYTWIRKEQREQNKALNIAIGYIHTKNILHSVDSGAEDRINKSINKDFIQNGAF